LVIHTFSILEDIHIRWNIWEVCGWYFRDRDFPCRHRQTRQQIGALLLLLVAAVLLSLGKSAPKKRSKEAEVETTLWLGIIPILVASVLSGLASTLCQWAAQVYFLMDFICNALNCAQLSSNLFHAQILCDMKYIDDSLICPSFYNGAHHHSSSRYSRNLSRTDKIVEIYST
jgi:hypothetical protein